MKANIISILLLVAAGGGLSLRANSLDDGLEAERRGDLTAAVDLFRQSLKDQPDDRPTQKALARVQNEMDRRQREKEAADRRQTEEEVGQRVEEANRLKETRDRRCAEGRRFLSQGEPLRAWDVFQRLLKEDPNSPPARQGAERSQKVLEMRIQAGEFTSPRHYAAAQGALLYGQGRWSDAARLFEKTLEGGRLPADLAAARVAEYAAEARRRASAKTPGGSLSPLVTSSAPEDPTAAPEAVDEAERQYREGLRLFGTDRPAEARTCFEKALALNPRHREAKEALDRLNGESR